MNPNPATVIVRPSPRSACFKAVIPPRCEFNGSNANIKHVCNAGASPPPPPEQDAQASTEATIINAYPSLHAGGATRMFSNVNPRTLRHDPGSIIGSALLVAGTTIGAGILALPAVTQEAGFVPSAATLTVVCLFSAATGLLVAEVNLKIMRDRGAGGVSLITMARETLGETGALASSAAYVFLHYALLVAYISKAGEIIAESTGLPLVPGAAAFAGAFALLCYASSQKLLDQLNGLLVGLVVASFMGLLGVAASGVDAGSLVTGGDWSAVPATLPVVALAFVYHNIIPVICQALEGDVAKIRTAVITGLAIPWLMFVSWEGAILGSLSGLSAAEMGTVTMPATSVAITSQKLPATPTSQGAAPSATEDVQWATQPLQQGVYNLYLVRGDPEYISQSPWLAPQPVLAQYASHQQTSDTTAAQLVANPNQQQQLPVQHSRAQIQPGVAVVAAQSSSSSSTDSPRVADPLAALSSANPVTAPLIKAFSFLAIGTSYIGFILGLTDFLADALKLQSGRQTPVPYLLTILPPFAVAVTNPNIFLQALDIAGTYGVLTLFGIQPAAMAWSARYGGGGSSSSSGQQQGLQDVVPGGKAALVAIGGAAAGVILYELLKLIIHEQ